VNDETPRLTENAPDLAKRGVQLDGGEVLDHVQEKDAVEVGVAERKLSRVTLHEAGSCAQVVAVLPTGCLGNGERRGCEVDTDRVCAPVGCLEDDLAATGADVEDAVAGFELRELERQNGELCRRETLALVEGLRKLLAADVLLEIGLVVELVKAPRRLRAHEVTVLAIRPEPLAVAARHAPGDPSSVARPTRIGGAPAEGEHVSGGLSHPPEPLEEPRVPIGDFTRRTLETFASLVASTVAAGVLAVVVARALGPDGLGVLSVLFLFPVVGTLIVGGALGLANVYLGAGRPAARGALLTNSLLAAGLGGAVLAAATFAVLDLTGARFGATRHELAVALAVVPVTTGAKLVAALVLATERSRAYGVASASGQVLLVPSTLGAFALLDTSILAVVYAFVASEALALLASLALLGVRPALPSRLLFEESLRYGLRGVAGNLLQFLNYRLDFFLVSTLRGSSAVGIYSAAVSLAELLWKIPIAASTVLFPRVAAEASGGEEFTARVSRMALAATAAAGALLAVTGYPLVLLFFGRDFGGAYLPLLLLLPGVVALASANVLASDFAGRGRPEFGTYASALSLAVTVALDIALIPPFGGAGAAIASSVSYAAASLFLVGAFVRRRAVPARDLVVPSRTDWEGFRTR
jgi:O-antigen/teichoic acid export membrane protein